MSLLSTGNSKTIKGEKQGFRTFILHLAPAKLSGYNVCPMASKGCAAACLNTAGRGRMGPVQKARIAKTIRFMEHRAEFMEQLIKDVKASIRNAERANLIPVFRLNGTSDIRWETVEVGGAKNIMVLFPHIQFYDYQKLQNRKDVPSNYHLTFSRSEENEVAALKVLAEGGNVAVVFATKKGQPLPETWHGYKVIDADEDDTRFRDPKNVVCGLRGKGEAKKGSFGGFVVSV